MSSLTSRSCVAHLASVPRLHVKSPLSLNQPSGVRKRESVISNGYQIVIFSIANGKCKRYHTKRYCGAFQLFIRTMETPHRPGQCKAKS